MGQLLGFGVVLFWYTRKHIAGETGNVERVI